MSYTLGTANYFLNRTHNTEIDFNYYCEKHELQHIVTECTKFYVRKANIQPQTAFQEFVNCYFKGETVLLRPFSQICNSKMNRLLFVINFQKIFESFEDKSGFDYYQLTKLLCSDFPREILINSLTLHYQLDEELLLKKNYTLQQFCKSLLFELIFDDFLKEISNKFNGICNTETLIPILKKIYKINDEQPFLPNPAAVFECLIKYSNEKNKPCQFPILPFTCDMFSTNYLIGGAIDFGNFKSQLFKNPKIDHQLTKLINMIDNANIRIQENDEDVKKKKQK